jgi:fused signal recognition particle receptor
MARWNPFGKSEKKPVEDATTDSPSTDTNSTESPPEAEKPKKTSFFGGIKQALKKTVRVLNTDIRDLVKEEGRLVDDQFLDELFAHLIKTDMGNGPAGKIRDSIGKKYRARVVKMSEVIETAKETITEIMQQEAADIIMATEGPTVIMVVGVNGAGKTTSIAKLVNLFKKQGKSVVLGAGDTFRAAAVEQLTVWSQRMGAEIVTGRQGSDPASVAYKAVDTAVKTNADICIVDTAGRLQTQSNLMEELGRIGRVMKKVVPEAPHEVLLVLDSTAGQNAISQARGFSEAASCTGIVLAKLDGSAKGGVAIPIREEFGLPVKFVGLGETPEDFAPFDVQSYVDALFDVADDE